MRKTRIASSLAAGIVSEVANKIFPLLTLHFAAERLGVRSFGLSQFAQYLIDLAIFFVVFGYQSWGMIAWRHAKPEERSSLFSSAVLLRLIHAGIAGIILVAVMAQNTSWNIYQGIVVQSIFVLLTTALDGVWAMTAMNLLPVLSTLSIVAKTLSLVFIFAFVRGEQDATIYTIAIMGANALVSLGSFLIVIRHIGWSWPSVSRMTAAFRGAIPFAISFFLLIGLERFDLAVVEKYVGAVGAGFYSGPLKIAQSIIPIAGMVTTVFFAEMLGVYDQESLLRHLRAGLRVAILILSPIVAGVWFVDSWIVQIILGDAFVAHSRLLSIMTSSVMAQMLILAFGNQVLAIRGKMTFYNVAMAIGLIAGIIAALVFGNAEHLNVFATASSAGRWVAAVLIIGMSLRVLGEYKGVLWEMLRASCPAIVMAAILYFADLENFIFNLGLGIMVHAVVTFILFRDTVRRVLRKLTKLG